MEMLRHQKIKREKLYQKAAFVLFWSFICVAIGYAWRMMQGG